MSEPKTQTSWIALLVIAIIAFGILLAIRPDHNMGTSTPGLEDAELLLNQTADSINGVKVKNAKATPAPVSTAKVAAPVAPKVASTAAPCPVPCPPTPAPTARTAWAGSVHHANP